MSRLAFTGGSVVSAALLLGVASAVAAPPVTLPEVVVTADKPATANGETAAAARPFDAETLSGSDLTSALTGDTAAMMTRIPGLQVATGGGVSSLPVYQGFADDRINVLTMGMAITSACANHMNPPLSYVDPAGVGKITVIPTVSSVSRGGDAIGGSVLVEPRAPRFATGEKSLFGASGIEVHGALSTFYRSNGVGFGGSLNTSIANRDWEIDYTGAWTKAGNYRAGGGQLVRSSEYEAQNHLLRLAHRTDIGLFTLSAGLQDIPKQGFPNAWMDMLYNHAGFVNAGFEGAFDWGKLDVKAYWHHTEHYMNFLDDKGGSTTSSGMPMYTRGNDIGYSVKATIDWTKQDILRIGNEFHYTGLDDWWPAVPGSMMMAPNAYKNINDGRRDRFGTYAEWERAWSPQWSTVLGGRIDVVDMNTGNVQDYGCGMMCMADAAAAAAFNAAKHHKTDIDFDLTALLKWKPDDRVDAEFGYARKSRSPNLYERFAWGTGGMATQMIGWFGDGNGYMGNLDLKPEVSHTVSTTIALHDAESKRWSAKITPYLSYVENFIDADRVAPTPMGWDPNFAYLKFANHDALLWGVDVSGKTELASSTTWGSFALSGSASYTHGRNLDTRDGLYRIMPLNGTIALEHSLLDWKNTFEVKAVSKKTDVSTTRLEQQTPGYVLANYRTAYHWQNIDVSLGVDNIFDRKYSLPLGGSNVTDYGWYGDSLHPVYGTGRSFWASLAVKF